MTPKPKASEVCGAYVALLRHHLDDECSAALEAANTYKRQAVRDAFAAGWYAWRHRVALGNGWTSPHLSQLARGAFLRGLAAREQYEINHHSLEEA